MEKTIYSGMPQAEPSVAPNPSAQAKGTIYPGMPTNASAPVKNSSSNGKPIMGFLFSVSRTPLGEYWPIYFGPNNIGRDEANPVCLHEATVSFNHATLVVRKMQHQGENNGIFVFVQDTGSTCGTMLNGDTLDFSPRECKSGDVITIGENYELLLIIINPEAAGLSAKESFQSTEKAAASPAPQVQGWAPSQNGIGMQAGDMHKGTLPGTSGFGTPAQGPAQFSQPSNNPFESRKATIYMPNKK